MKTFDIILATDLTGGLGYNGNLPWDFKLDKLYFRHLTKTNTILPLVNNQNNILIVGRNTWETLKDIIKDRTLFIVTSGDFINYDNNYFFKSFHEAYLNAISFSCNIWVIGGAKLYDIALRHYACNKVYLTLIDGYFNVDVKINLDNYNIKWENEIIRDDLNMINNQLYKLSFMVGIVRHGVESQYLKTLYNVLVNGDKRETRNGITLSLFNKTLSWDLAEGFPLLTTKKMFWKGIVEELLFFIRGDTNTNKLSEKGIKIWELNTNRSFLDKLGLNYEEGEMGPMYGYQWRFYNKDYLGNNNFKGIDQLSNIISEIRSNPNSRRLLMTDFNPLQVEQGVLYPCHSIIIQFYINDNKLSCNMYQRSGDLFLGIPFNIASTSLLLHIIAKLTDLEASKVNLIIGDYHIYNQHINMVLEQLSRVPYDLPKLKIPDFRTLEEVEKSSFTDYKIINYNSHPAIKAEMIA